MRRHRRHTTLSGASSALKAACGGDGGAGPTGRTVPSAGELLRSGLVLALMLLVGGGCSDTLPPTAPDVVGGVPSGPADTTSVVPAEAKGTVRIFTETRGAWPRGRSFLVFDLDDVLGIVALVPNGWTEWSLRPQRYDPLLYPAPNCRSQGDDSSPVDVMTGDTVELRIVLLCEPEGTVKLTLSGTSQDVDRFDVALSKEGTAEPVLVVLGLDQEVSRMLTVGDWTAQLQLPEGCSTPRPEVAFTLVEGQEVSVDLTVDCVPRTGTLEVSVLIGRADEVFALNVNGGCPSGSDVFNWDCIWLTRDEGFSARMRPGMYALELLPTRSGCSVDSENPVVAEVLLGVTTEVAFSARCD